MLPNSLTLKRFMVGLVLLTGLSGAVVAEEYENPQDPWEGYNRAIFAVNEGLDSVIVKPIAKTYEFIFPEPIRILVTNVFSNLSDVVIGINDLLQGRGEQAVNDFGRVLINTTLGFGGLFDVAGNAGWYKSTNDFGVTFGRWGIPSGPYFVLPILGPSNIRDTFGWAADIAASPLSFAVTDPTAYYTAWGVNYINTRANLFPAEKIIEEAATDKYSYLRDAFMQNRLNLIREGAPPPVLDDPGDEPEATDKKVSSPTDVPSAPAS